MRLGLIGANGNTKRTSGVYTPEENIALLDAKTRLGEFSYDGVFNALSSSGTEEGFDVSRDGRYVYVAVRGTRTTATIFQYECSTPWDLSTIVYSNKSLVVGDYDINCNCISITDDGTRLYFAGYANDAIWSCTLSTPYDLATAVVDVGKVYVGGQAAEPRSPRFGDNGTKLYIVDTNGDRVYQYTLTTAWDVTTAIYSNKSLLVSAVDGTPTGLFFKDDGTKLYIIGYGNDIVASYTLSTAWDVSTGIADYALKSYSVATQIPASAPSNLFVGDNGTKLYVLSGFGAPTDTIFQYTLSTPWDISTASYANKSLNVNALDGVSSGLFFKDDGTKAYITGETNDIVTSFTLSTAWDISTGTADYSAKTYSVAAQIAVNTFQGTFIGDNGTKMYALAGQSATIDTIFQYTLSTPWDVSTASYASKSLNVNLDGSATQLFLSDDGTKVYIVGDTTDSIFSYTLSTPWDISTGTPDYVAKTYSVATQVPASTFVSTFIGDNGTKMYALSGSGAATDIVYQYTLSTAWNVSTATYASKSLTVSTLDATTEGMYFSDNGTKLYLVGTTNDIVISYTLSTAWDIATATADYAPKTYSVATQVIANSFISTFIGDNGTKMYALSGDQATTDTVYQYTLSTAWNVSTASYASKSFSVNGQDTNTRTVFFKDDGTKMYIMGKATDTIYQYSLSTAWDISTASYDSVSFSVTLQDTEPTDVFFGDNGTKMYVIGDTGDDVNQYDLSTAWNISTASFVRVSTGIGEAGPQAVAFSNDGTKMYVSGNTGDTIREFTLSTAWDVSTISFRRQYPIGYLDGTPTGIFFKNDGTEMYVTGYSNRTVYQLSLATAWDSGSVKGRFWIGNEEGDSRGIYIGDNGTKMYIIGLAGDDVNQYDLSAAWDISTASFVRVSANIGDTDPSDVFFKSDGTKMYVMGDGNNVVREFTLSVAWDVSTISFSRLCPVGFLDGSPTGIFFKGDGTEMYITGWANRTVYQLTLKNAWTTSIGRLPVGTEDTAPYGVFIGDSGTKMYVLGQAGDDVNQYDLSVAWDINSATFVRVSANVGDATPQGLFFKNDGTKMYINGNTGDTIREFTLSTAWNVSTISFRRAYSVGYLDGTPAGVFFKNDGTEMYITGYNNRTIYQLSLTTAWDSASVKGRFWVGAEDGNPRGVYIDSSGLKMYIMGYANDRVYQYDLGTAWDVSTAVLLRSSPTVGEANANALFFKDDGTKMYITGDIGDTIREFTLSTAWDVSTISFRRAYFIGYIETTPTGLFFKNDGTEMYFTGHTNRGVYQFSLTTAWDSASVKGRFWLGNEESEPLGIYIKPDGLKMYMVGQGGDDVNEYNLGSAWDISTASFVRVSATVGDTNPNDIWFKDDGTKMYIAAYGNRTIREFILSSAWDISTISFSKSLPVGFESLPVGVTLKNDGTKIYVVGHTNDCVYEIPLATAWDTGSSNGFSFHGSLEATIRGLHVQSDGQFAWISGDSGFLRRIDMAPTYELTGNATSSSSASVTNPYGIHWSADGTIMYLTVGPANPTPAGGRQVRQIKGTTPFSIGSISLTELIPLVGLTGNTTVPWGVRVSPDGTRMFVLVDNTQGIHQFSLRFA